MRQSLVIVNSETLEANAAFLRTIRTGNMRATRPQDVVEILARVPDKKLFNSNLQKLLFEDLIPQWSDLDAEQRFEAIGQVARWQQIANANHASAANAGQASNP